MVAPDHPEPPVARQDKCFDGGESFRQARHTATLGVAVHKLPSTSPANASWSFERKLAAWREVVASAGLL